VLRVLTFRCDPRKDTPNSLSPIEDLHIDQYDVLGAGGPSRWFLAHNRSIDLGKTLSMLATP
jgi:hypothetical protein